MAFERSARRTKPIPLTPLIDVVFLLIVFFMLSTTFIKIEAFEISFAGGDKEAAKPASKERVTRIDLGGRGRIFFNGEVVDSAGFEQRIDQQIREKPAMPFLVRAGERVPVQRLVDALDTIHRLGGRNVAVDRWDEGERAAAEAKADEHDTADPLPEFEDLLEQ